VGLETPSFQPTVRGRLKERLTMSDIHRGEAPPPLIPNDITARRRQAAERTRQKLQHKEDALKAHDRLVAAGNLVQGLGQRYELELDAGEERLKAWVQAMADYKCLLAEQGLLDRLAQRTGVLNEQNRYLDDWQAAVAIFEAADTDPGRAVAELERLAREDPGFAGEVARQLRHEIRAVAEGYRLDSLGPASGGATESPPLPRLTPRQRRILRLMASPSWHATSEGDAMTRQAIVEALGEQWHPENWRDEFGGLKKLGLTEGKPGPKGGVWLTARGIEVAPRLPAK
jgi:hypothetical protein